MNCIDTQQSLPGSKGEHTLQDEMGTGEKAKDFYQRQMLPKLAPGMQDFIKKQEMVFLSTSDVKGECDSSFRSGDAGFVLVLDDKRLAYAECKGNGVMASMGNISENPHIGMLFLDFLEDKVGLHVNGKARIMSSDTLKSHLDKNAFKKVQDAEQTLNNKQVAWILVDVEEAYIHCSKNIPLFDKNEDIKALSTPRPIDYFKLGN